MSAPWSCRFGRHRWVDGPRFIEWVSRRCGRCGKAQNREVDAHIALQLQLLEQFRVAVNRPTDG